MDAATALRIQLKRDKRWQQFRSALASAYLPEFDGYIEEMQALHKTRGIRVLGAQALPTGKKVANAAMQDQSVRSRCVEIAVNVTRQRNYLAAIRDATRGYLIVKYGATLQQHGARTITDRREIIGERLDKADQIIGRLDSITEICDMLIKDLDQGNWALSRVVDALQVATKREAARF